MDKINDRQARNMIFNTAYNHLRNGDIDAAIEVYAEALKTFPNDEGIMSVAICTECDLLGKIEALRVEIDAGAPTGMESLRRLPHIRIRDKGELAPRQVRVRRYADYLLDEEFVDPADAVVEVIIVLRRMAGLL